MDLQLKRVLRRDSEKGVSRRCLERPALERTTLEVCALTMGRWRTREVNLATSLFHLCCRASVCRSGKGILDVASRSSRDKGRSRRCRPFEAPRRRSGFLSAFGTFSTLRCHSSCFGEGPELNFSGGCVLWYVFLPPCGMFLIHDLYAGC